MGKYLGCGKYNTYYKYILLTTLFSFLSAIIFGYGYCNNSDSLKYTRIYKKLSQHLLSRHIIIHNIYCNFGILIISVILYNYEKYTSKSEKEKEKSNNTAGIKLIHSNTEKDLEKKSLLTIIIVIILYIFQDILTILYFQFELSKFNFWILELPLLSYFNFKLLNTKIYNHHKFAIYLSVIVCLTCKIILFLISVFSEGSKELVYNQHKFLYLVGIFSYLIIITIRAYTVTEIKIFMDLRYISPSKLLIIYGIIGIIVNVIICVVFTYIKCKPVGDFDIHLCDIYNKNNNEYYLDNYDIYLQILSDSTNKEMIIEIITSLIAAITYLLYIYFYILIIKYLTPVHTLFAALVYGFFVRIISLIYMSISNKNNSPSNEGNQSSILIIFKNIFDFLSSTFTCVGLFIYLELIELKFCNLDFNLRANIMKRSLEDIDYFKIEEKEDDKESCNSCRNSSSICTELSDRSIQNKENEINEKE